MHKRYAMVITGIGNSADSLVPDGMTITRHALHQAVSDNREAAALATNYSVAIATDNSHLEMSGEYEQGDRKTMLNVIIIRQFGYFKPVSLYLFLPYVGMPAYHRLCTFLNSLLETLDDREKQPSNSDIPKFDL